MMESNQTAPVHYKLIGAGVICPEKKRLTDELGEVIKRILELHSREAEALIAGDLSDRPPLAGELKRFQEKRAHLLARIRAHAAEHGC